MAKSSTVLLTEEWLSIQSSLTYLMNESINIHPVHGDSQRKPSQATFKCLLVSMKNDRANINICDWLWEKGHIRAYFQNRVIGTAG